jgi:endonuclease-3
MPNPTTSARSDGWPDDRQRRLDAVVDRLEIAYGRRRWRPHHPPLDELILTVLSQHTSDVNTERAYRSLRARFPTWEETLRAPPAEVAEAIRGGGLAEIKAPRIQGILRAVRKERGGLSLDHLAALPLEEARRWLLALDGVGPKTAACVLLFSLGRPALPVDTHVHRAARRVGLIGPTTNAASAHVSLERGLGTDRDRVYAFHLNAIAHGRAVCTARQPFCNRCPLTGSCDYYASHHGQADAAAAPTPPAPGGR